MTTNPNGTTDPAYSDANPLLAAALDYAARGWPVLPLRPRDKTPNGLLAPHGLNDASTDLSQITTWWRRVPNANVGIRTGLGLDVVDLDGEAARQSFIAAFTEPIVPGMVVRTARGWHLWFTSSGFPSRAGLLEGIDVRGRGGYVVAPPSVHPSGAVYRLVDPTTGTILDQLPPDRLAPAPNVLVDWCRTTNNTSPTNVAPNRPNPNRPNPIRLSTEHYVRVAVESECVGVASAPEGTRNQRLNRGAFALGTLIGAGLLDAEAARTQLFDAAMRAGLEERETLRTIASGLTAGEQKPRYRSDAAGSTEQQRAREQQGARGGRRTPDPTLRPNEPATAAVLSRTRHARRGASSANPRPVQSPPLRERER